MNTSSVWVDRLLAPRKFSDPTLEEEFRREYHAEGRIVTVYAFILGATLALVSFLLIEFRVVPASGSEWMQGLRLTAVFAMGIAILVLIKAKEFALRNYSFSVGFPLFIASIIIGSIAYLNSTSETPHQGRFLVAYVVFVWLCFSFTRLPTWLVLLVSGLAAFPVYLSSISQHTDDRFAVLTYLVISNATGWISYVQIERRERRLFMQARSLLEMSSRLEKQVEIVTEVSRAKERVLHSVVHDLKQPLVSLSIYFAQLRIGFDSKQASSVASAEIVFQRIESCLAMARESIDSLLNGDGREMLEVAPIRLVPALNRLIQIHEAVANSAGVRVASILRLSDAVEVRSNRNAFNAIVTNILTNAIKFSAAKGVPNAQVLVTAIAIEDCVRIDVLDSGIGIPAAELNRVFDLGYRGKNARAGNIEGRGIGLSSVGDLCNRLPEHKVEIASVEGKGCRVRLRIGSIRRA